MKSSLQGFDRIIDGETPPAPIPWQAHMRQGNPNGGFTYFCGGTILDEKTILTAAQKRRFKSLFDICPKPCHKVCYNTKYKSKMCT